MQVRIPRPRRTAHSLEIFEWIDPLGWRDQRLDLRAHANLILSSLTRLPGVNPEQSRSKASAADAQ